MLVPALDEGVKGVRKCGAGKPGAGKPGAGKSGAPWPWPELGGYVDESQARYNPATDRPRTVCAHADQDRSAPILLGQKANLVSLLFAGGGFFLILLVYAFTTGF